MAYQWANSRNVQYAGQSYHDGHYDQRFEDDYLDERRGQNFHQFQNRSYVDGANDFDSPDYQDFDSQRNWDFDSRRNGDFDSSRNGDFDSPRIRDFDSPRIRDFDSPRSRNFESARNRDSLRNGNFNSSWNRGLDSRSDRNFDSAWDKDYGSSSDRDFPSPRSRDFDLNSNREFDSPQRRELISAGFPEGRSYRAHDNYAYRDDEEYERKTSPAPQRNRDIEPFEQNSYDDISTDRQYYDEERNFRSEDRDSESGSERETFSRRITTDSRPIWDRSDTIVVRKRKNLDSGDQESVSDSSSLKAVPKSKSIRKSGNVNMNTLPSRGQRMKSLHARKLEALGGATDLKEYTEVYRDQILKEPVQSTHILKYEQKKAWQNFKQQAKNVLYQLELWSGAFKEIEGHFGTSVMTYFRFMRWLLFLNFYLMVIMLGLTMVPYVIKINRPWRFLDIAYPTNHSKTSNVTNSTGVGVDFFGKAFNCTENYLDFLHNASTSEDWGSKVLDALQGTGWMEHTVLFYGSYFNKTYSLPFVEGRLTYNMGLSYILATGAAFLISFLLIVRNSAKGIRTSVLDEGSGPMTQYCNKVFGGWDFCISDQKAAKDKHKNLCQELRGDLENQKQLWRKENRTTREKARLYTIRVVVNVVVVGFLGGSLYLIYFANNSLIDLQREFGDVHAIVQTLIQFMPSVTITVLNIIVPIIFVKLVQFEDYMPAFQMQITLLRTVILRLASLLVLMASLYGMVVEKNEDFCDDCGNKRWEAINQTSQAPIKCWETYVGQQIYKLIILDFLVPFILTFVVEYPRRLVYQRFHEKFKLVDMMGQQEFDLPKAVLDLVYTQTLCWMGLFFCPFTPLMSFVKCIIFFYVKKGTVLNNCIQPVRPFRTSKSNSLFIAVLFISFIISTGPMTYMIGVISPSQSCGPFRVYSMENFVFFDTIRNLIYSFPSDAQNFFHFFGTMAFFLPAIAIACFIMYCYCVQSIGYKRKAKLLREDLIMEGKDKQFLLARVNEAWMYLEG